MIEIKNLTYSVKQAPVIRGINADFYDGEIIGICGPAGSGKSTLLKILACLIRDYSGEILINDNKLPDVKANNLCCFLQSPPENINREISLKTAVLKGRAPQKKILNPFSELDHQVADEYIDHFKLTDFSGMKLKSLSDSIIQSTALARTFTSGSDILLLDSPEIFLNIDQRLKLMRAIKKYVLNGKRIILLASSDINLISAICDRIIIMVNGIITLNGTTDLISESVIKKNFGIEVLISKNIVTGRNEIQVLENS